MEVKGEELLMQKQQLIDYDHRRNQNREALAALRRIERQKGQTELDVADVKQYVCIGGNFIKLPTEKVKTMLRKGGPCT